MTVIEVVSEIITMVQDITQWIIDTPVLFVIFIIAIIGAVIGIFKRLIY